ncbi:MAG: hypothetical protein EXS30_08685 [Pedosphaera sp.]|nr:hypothetical protein [Pedosphaera sp.]
MNTAAMLSYLYDAARRIQFTNPAGHDRGSRFAIRLTSEEGHIAGIIQEQHGAVGRGRSFFGRIKAIFSW